MGSRFLYCQNASCVEMGRVIRSLGAVAEQSQGTVMKRVIIGCLGLSIYGCAVFYPQLSTPVRGAVSEDRYDPPPPKDVIFVAIAKARIPSKTRDGRSWDKGGGAAPDPYAILTVDGKETLRTSVVPNSLRPHWPNPSPMNLRIPRSAKVRLEVWDDNAIVSHPICNQAVRDLHDAADIGQTEVECENGASVTLVVRPPKARLGIGLTYEVRGKEAYVSRVIAASAAGRAGLEAGDQILTVDGKRVESMAAGELESIFNGKSASGVVLEVRSGGGGKRKVNLSDEPMYPVQGEGIEFAAEPASASERHEMEDD